MLRFSVILAMMLCLVSTRALGQSSQAPPLVNRPAQFSGLVGDYTIRATAEPVEVQVEDPFTLRITLKASGEVPSEYQPDPRKLKLFPPGFEERFFVEERPEEHRLEPEQKRWTIAYRLRPKLPGSQSIENLTLVYWQPRLKRFQTRYADSIAMKVTPRRDAEVVLPTEVELAPASFYEVPIAARVLATWPPPSVPSLGAVAVAFAVPPIVAILGLLWWRRWYPGEVEKNRRQRRRMLRETLAGLQGGAPLWPVLQRHFVERWGFASEQPTPREVAGHLRRLGIAKPLYGRVESLLRGCDAARYAPVPTADAALRVEAIALLQDLECDPCA